MKIYTTRYLSLFISFFITISIASGIYVIDLLGFDWQLYLIILLVSFLVWFILLFYLLNNYIIARIKPIYKLIHNLKLSSADLYAHVENKDIIAEVQKEVTDWAENKSTEIAKLKAGEKYRKEFLANVSHELKTPLFSIQGYVYTLLDGGLQDDEINVTYLEKTKKNVNRIIDIVNDIEKISRIEAGELQPDFIAFDIAKLIKEVFELNELQATRKNIKLRLDNFTGHRIKVVADKKMIYEVITNLVSNAIKYGNKEGLIIVSIQEKSEEVIQISIRDNGIGISENDLPRIFERFYRADKSRSREQGGTGLGLAIVKHALEAHKQTISVASEQGIGTTFVFTLKKHNSIN